MKAMYENIMRLDIGIFLLLACAATSCSGKVSPAFISPVLRATVESESSLHHLHPAIRARHQPRAMLSNVFCQEGVPINEAFTSVRRSFSNGLPGMNLPKVIHSATKSVSLSKQIEVFAEEGDYSAAAAALCDASSLKTLDPSEILRLWSMIPSSEMDMVSAYVTAVDQKVQDLGTSDTARSLPPATLTLEVAESIISIAEFLSVCSGKHAEALCIIGRAEKLLMGEWQEETLDLCKKKDEALSDCLSVSAAIMSSMGDYFGAKCARAKSLKVKEDMHGESSSVICADVVALASLARQCGQIDEALLMIQRAGSIAIQGGGYPDLMRLVKSETSAIYKERGDFDLALVSAQSAMDMNVELFGANHQDSAAAQDALGLVLQKLGRYSEAEKLHHEALNIKKSIFGPDHIEIASTLFNLGVCAEEGLSDFMQGKKYKAEALTILEAQLPSNHPQIGVAINGLGENARASGEYEEAQALFEKACNILRDSLGSSHALLATALNNLGQTHRAQGRYDQALLLMQQSADIKREVLPANHPSIATALSNLASILEEGYKDLDRSLDIRKSALAMIRESLGPRHPQVAVHLLNIAVTFTRMGDYETALDFYDKALEIDEEVYGPDHPQVATDLNNMATFRFHLGQWQLSRQLYERALAIRFATLGEGHPKTKSTEKNLAVVIQQLSLSEAGDDGDGDS